MSSPLISVGGVTTLPCPGKFIVKLSDVSSSDAGRTQSGLMYKNRIGQAVHIELAWNALSTADASRVLGAFNPEYISVRYIDPYVGGAVTRTFYVGDRTAPMYNCDLDLWESVSFNIIERGVH